MLKTKFYKSNALLNDDANIIATCSQDLNFLVLENRILDNQSKMIALEFAFYRLHKSTGYTQESIKLVSKHNNEPTNNLDEAKKYLTGIHHKNSGDFELDLNTTQLSMKEIKDLTIQLHEFVDSSQFYLKKTKS